MPKNIGIPEEHRLALQNKYLSNLSDDEKMRLKYEAAKAIRVNKAIQLNGVNKLFSQFYYYYFFSAAVSNGFELLGIEDSSYSPGLGIFQVNRDDAIVANVMKHMDENENCIMVIGATHGIDLIQAFRTKIIDQRTPSMQFKTIIEQGDFILADNQSYLYLDLSQKSKQEQEVLFSERMLAVQSADELVYHQYGRRSWAVGSSFAVHLSHLTKLSFFSTMDDKHSVADAVCMIDDENEKQIAKTIQGKTGLGAFFRTDQGKDVFVIKNTNNPEGLVQLRESLNSLSSNF